MIRLGGKSFEVSLEPANFPRLHRAEQLVNYWYRRTFGRSAEEVRRLGAPMAALNAAELAAVALCRSKGNQPPYNWIPDFFAYSSKVQKGNPELDKVEIDLVTALFIAYDYLTIRGDGTVKSNR